MNRIPQRLPERPAHLIRVAVPRLNKCDHISEYLKQIDARDYDLEWAEVAETQVLTPADWNAFMSSLLTDRDWLAGKGGTGTWADVPNVSFFSLTAEQQDAYKRCAFLSVVAVTCGGRTVYVDPQGYEYARYMAFAADGLPEPLSREELRRAREQKQVADTRAARIAAVVNPAPVPADHGLRFFWNGIKAADGKLQKCHYSLGLNADWPAETISIYARDYCHFNNAVQRCFVVTNDSDTQSDYFADDTIRVGPAHDLYAAVRAAYEAQEAHYKRERDKREQRQRLKSIRAEGERAWAAVTVQVN